MNADYITEAEFIQAVDCRFPYDDEKGARELIKLGASISPNAAFMVLHEICRPPRSSRVSDSRLKALLEEWITAFYHPLVSCVLPAATAMLEKQEISVEDAICTMTEIAAHRNQFCALSIPYFACDDIGGAVDAEYQKITRAWERAVGDVD